MSLLNLKAELEGSVRLEERVLQKPLVNIRIRGNGHSPRSSFASSGSNTLKACFTFISH